MGVTVLKGSSGTQIIKKFKANPDTAVIFISSFYDDMNSLQLVSSLRSSRLKTTLLLFVKTATCK